MESRLIRQGFKKAFPSFDAACGGFVTWGEVVSRPLKDIERGGMVALSRKMIEILKS